MKVHAILNRHGGTLRTTDLELLSAAIRGEFQVHGHEAEVELVDGPEIGERIEAQARRTDLDVLMVGGGDGTVSSAAAAVAGGPIALGILPAGTMNLFARSLQIPMGLDPAVKALANGRIAEVDIASVNGRYFVHQFAVGMHARMVRTREKLDYSSRIGKMWASARAVVTAAGSLPMVDLRFEIDGKTQVIRTPAVAISNNIYGDGHLPYADDPQGGKLGIYIMRATSRLAVLKTTVDMMRGAWKDKDNLTVMTADEIVIEHRRSKSRNRSVMDGELRALDRRSEVKIHPRGLKVLVPEEATF
ncbi:diacylglycerol kinase family protein [Aureimonas sp. Leaf324]|uniref:diacylglycerol/lipid kinase family protein n=1 Tax=Aureimonas sp. Leaf324 TaxID=1736336 RepID=UPI0006F44E2F|nr:diacylglycerol kinase family protein [Aureimonas sp. Leaf324]KQQ82150.1 diacylglycerol kinase [Aureimonas sp. Leaf324]